MDFEGLTKQSTESGNSKVQEKKIACLSNRKVRFTATEKWFDEKDNEISVHGKFLPQYIKYELYRKVLEFPKYDVKIEIKFPAHLLLDNKTGLFNPELEAACYEYQETEVQMIIGSKTITTVKNGLKIIAGPSVSIRIHNYKKVLDEGYSDYFGISIDILRVQSIDMVPIQNTPISFSGYLAPFFITASNKEQKGKEILSLLEGLQLLDDDRFPNPEDKYAPSSQWTRCHISTILVEPQMNGVILYSPAARVAVQVRVPTHDLYLDEPGINEIDALSRYSYYCVGNKGYGIRPIHDKDKKPAAILIFNQFVDVKEYDYWKFSYPTLEKSKNYEVYEDPFRNHQMARRVPVYYLLEEESEQNIQTWGSIIPSQYIQFMESANKNPFIEKWSSTVESYYIGSLTCNYLLDRVLEKNNQYSELIYEYYSGGFFDNLLKNPNTGREMLLLAISMTPVIGDFYDVAEFIYATVYGKDFQGKKLNLAEYIALFFYTLPVIPNLSKSANKMLSRTRKGIR